MHSLLSSSLFLAIVSTTVLLGALIFVHELGHFILAKARGVRVLKFSLGFGPKIIGKKVGDTEYLLSLVPWGGYVKMIGEDPEEEIAENDLSVSFSTQSILGRLYIVSAGPLFNLIFAFVIFSVIFMAGFPVLTTEVGEVKKDFPAYGAGIVSGDKIVAVDAKRVDKWDDIAEIIQKKGAQRTKITIDRKGKLLDLYLIPRIAKSQNIFGEVVESALIGIQSAGTFVSERYNPLDATIRGIKESSRIVYLTIIGLIKLITRQIPAKNLGGPLLIAQVAGKQAQAGALSFFFFMAVLSINLGLINLFPIPILDGGHIFFLGIEAIMGKPLDLKKREFFQQIGLVLLIGLMAFAFYNDLSRIFSH